VRLLRHGREVFAYHDSDAKNNGSGALNPANGSYLNEFRMNEGVTLRTQVRERPQIDDNPYDKVTPPANLLYWMDGAGEWFNVTVDVAETANMLAICCIRRIARSISST